MATTNTNAARPALLEPVASAVIDSAARGLYNYFGTCWRCHFEYSLAVALSFKCPFCGGMILPGPDITPERGREMLAELKARRVALGLPE